MSFGLVLDDASLRCSLLHEPEEASIRHHVVYMTPIKHSSPDKYLNLKAFQGDPVRDGLPCQSHAGGYEWLVLVT